MNDLEKRRVLGEATIKDVYAGDVSVQPPGNPFSDVMLTQLFAELWTRDILSMRDKRLLLLGIIAEKGAIMPFKVQIKAALKRGDMDIAESRELLLFIAQYSGYPAAATMAAPLEEAIAEFEKWKSEVNA